MTAHLAVLIIHLLCATIWVGGHLVLAIGFLPRALKQRDPSIVMNIEKYYEPIGMPALLILIMTGLWLSYDFGIGIHDWFTFSNGMESAISLKMILLFSTFGFALNARFRLIPHLTPKNFPIFALHMISVTLLGVFILILGATLRYGGL